MWSSRDRGGPASDLRVFDLPNALARWLIRPPRGGGIPDRLLRGGILLGLLLLAGCAGVSSLDSPNYANPERCDALVADHRADPRDLDEAGPRARQISVPPTPDTTGDAVVEFVVDEFGAVVDGSVVVSGISISSDRRRLEEAVDTWVFEPARVDGCWVPARSRVEVSLDRSLFLEIGLAPR